MASKVRAPITFMTLHYRFSGIRLQSAMMVPVDWNISVDLLVLDKKIKDFETSVNTVFQKLYFWLETNLPNVVIVNAMDSDDLYLANSVANMMLYCPGQVSDDIIAQTIHSKLSTLAGNFIELGCIKVSSSDSLLEVTFDTNGGNYKLPVSTTEYLTDVVVKDVVPWWARNDGFSFDFIRPPESNLSDEELFSNIIDPMDEFDRLIAENNEVNLKEPARIVQVEKWKPKTVD